MVCFCGFEGSEVERVPVLELIAALPFALSRLVSRPGAHWGSQYQVGAAIFLSASKAREKTRSHREHGILLQIPPGHASLKYRSFRISTHIGNVEATLRHHGSTELIATL